MKTKKHLLFTMLLLVIALIFSMTASAQNTTLCGDGTCLIEKKFINITLSTAGEDDQKFLFYEGESKEIIFYGETFTLDLDLLTEEAQGETATFDIENSDTTKLGLHAKLDLEDFLDHDYRENFTFEVMSIGDDSASFRVYNGTEEEHDDSIEKHEDSQLEFENNVTIDVSLISVDSTQRGSSRFSVGTSNSPSLGLRGVWDWWMDDDDGEEVWYKLTVDEMYVDTIDENYSYYKNDFFCPADCQDVTNECEVNSDCDDSVDKTKDECVGTLPKRCENTLVLTCDDGDGVCGPGCTEALDDDCEPEGECDDDIDCDDDDVSTDDNCVGVPKVCENSKINDCTDGDDFCPDSCSSTNDDDCEDVILTGNVSDTVSACITDSECNDSNESTVDVCDKLKMVCVFTNLTECIDNDEKCNEFCTNEYDNDCPPPAVCGDEICQASEDTLTCCKDCGCGSETLLVCEENKCIRSAETVAFESFEDFDEFIELESQLFDEGYESFKKDSILVEGGYKITYSYLNGDKEVRLTAVIDGAGKVTGFKKVGGLDFLMYFIGGVIGFFVLGGIVVGLVIMSSRKSVSPKKKSPPVNENKGLDLGPKKKDKEEDGTEDDKAVKDSAEAVIMNYVSFYGKQGYSHDQITKALLKYGYDEKQIEEVLKKAGK